MKSCPTCSRVYSDDTLNFCFEDRSPLTAHYRTDPFDESRAETLMMPGLGFSTSPGNSVQAYGQMQTGSAAVRAIEAVGYQPAEQTSWSGLRLATKLYLPSSRQTLVSRPRLIEKLNYGLKGKLTLISAPAGFGKTSLVTTWHQQSEMPLAWFSLDEDDNVPARFLDHLIGTLQTVDERIGKESSELLQISPPPVLKVFFSSLINEISESGVDFVLAFDDYQVIKEHRIHDALSFFVERLPVNAHVLVCTRSDPPFTLSRLRARGELQELRAVDLRFNETDTAEFLNGVMSLGLSSKDVTALEEKTEGWVTGLQLSALSLQGRENKSLLVKEFAGDDRFILDYLLEEVINRQTEGVRDFLLRTSILTRLNGSLCNAVTNQNNGHETLEFLSRSNLFLTALDSKSTWFRYHHLFGDLLRLKLKQKQSDLVTELQAKASVWCEENGFVEEAVNYALAARDWKRSLNLIEPIGYKLMSLGEFERLERWIEAIPKTELRTRPLLCYWYVTPLLYKDELDKVEKYLQIIETAEPEELRSTLITEVWTSRAFIAVVGGELDKAEEFSKKAFDFLPPDNIKQRAVAFHTKVCCARLKGDMKAIEQVLLEALPVYRLAENFLFEIWAKTYLGSIQAMQGHLREGAESLQGIIEYAKEHIPNRPETFIYPHSALCDIYREWNDPERAKIHLDEALTSIQRTGRETYMVLVPDSLKSIALMSEMCYEGARAQALVESALKRAKKYGNQTVARQLQALVAFVSLRRGDISFVNRWAESSGLEPEDEVTYQTELPHITYARWLIATGKAEKALPLLQRLQLAAENGSRQRVVLEVLVLQAVAHESCGNEKKAINTLEEALLLAEPESYVRSFVDEGEPISKLLIESLKKNGKRWEIEKPELLRYVVRLNKSFGAASHKPQKQKIAGDDLPWWYVNDPLSERELEVMQLVAQGLSNQEIGNKIFISSGTVKRHLSNIYQKLDVHSRVQAIELARKFQLIPATND